MLTEATLNHLADSCLMKMKEIVDQIEVLIRKDEKQEFTTYLRSLVKEHDDTILIPLQGEVFKFICLHRAIGCARALLELEADMGWTIKLNEPFYIDGEMFSALDLVVASQSYELTEIFVNHYGARQGVTSVEGEVNYVTTALSLALDNLFHQDYVSDWTPEKSIYKLFYILCLPELKESLDIVKLLASKTHEVHKVGFRCVDEGKLVQFSALLLVAWDNILDEQDKLGIIPLQDYICKRPKHDLLVLYIINKHLMDTMKILGKARQVLESFRNSEEVKSVRKEHLPLRISHQLKQLANISLDEDDIACDDLRCFVPRLLPQEVASLEDALEKRICAESTANKSSPISYSVDPCVMTWFDNIDVEAVVRDDDKEEFVPLVKALRSEYADDEYWVKGMAKRVMTAIFESDSVDCARAVLAGETEGALDFDWILKDGQVPLHYAAHVPAPRLTELFLDHGAGGERCTWTPLGLEEALPLDIILAKLCDRSLIHIWPKTNSITDLIAEICDNEYGPYLETLRLLVLRTPNIQREFCKYLNERRILEVCAMLLVAHEQFRDLNYSGSSSRSCRGLLRRAPHYKRFGTMTCPRALGEFKEVEKAIPTLLKTFERVGEWLAAYIRLDKERRERGSLTKLEVSWILNEAQHYDFRASKAFNQRTLKGMPLGPNQSPLPKYEVRELHTSAKLGSICFPSVSPPRRLLHCSTPILEVGPLKRYLHTSSRGTLILQVLKRGLRRRM